MKIREIVMLSVGTIAVLIFMGFMFDYYLRTEEVQTIRKDMYFDSLILQEQRELRKKDSLLDAYVRTEDASIKHRLNSQEQKIRKIQEELSKQK